MCVNEVQKYKQTIYLEVYILYGFNFFLKQYGYGSC